MCAASGGSRARSGRWFPSGCRGSGQSTHHRAAPSVRRPPNMTSPAQHRSHSTSGADRLGAPGRPPLRRVAGDVARCRSPGRRPQRPTRRRRRYHPGTMYARFFGLQREPFSIAPDPRYLFMSESATGRRSPTCSTVCAAAAASCCSPAKSARQDHRLPRLPRAGAAALQRGLHLQPDPDRRQAARLDLRRVRHLARALSAGHPRADGQAVRRCAQRIPAAHARGGTAQRARDRRGSCCRPRCSSSCAC